MVLSEPLWSFLDVPEKAFCDTALWPITVAQRFLHCTLDAQIKMMDLSFAERFSFGGNVDMDGDSLPLLLRDDGHFLIHDSDGNAIVTCW